MFDDSFLELRKTNANKRIFLTRFHGMLSDKFMYI